MPEDPPEPTRAWPLIPAVLAGAGVWLAADALRHGGLSRYRLVGLTCGAVLCAPLAVVAVFGGRGRAALRKAAFALVPLVLLLLLLEGAVRVLDIANPTAGELVVEPALGYTLRPQPGVADANGFRNAAVPAAADVLFVGDSLTWGFGVPPATCYPRRFAERTGRTVYNASLGGYGPIQYRELVRRHLALRPRDVVVGVYLGNDVVNAVQFGALAIAADLRRSDFVYAPVPPLPGPAPAPNLAMWLVDGACTSSRLLAISGGALKEQLRRLGGGYDDEPGAPRWDEPGTATLFAPQWCVPVDLATEAAREGIRLTQRCLADIGRDCAAAGARAWLLALPTKEAVYAAWFAERGLPRPELDLAAANGRALGEAFAATARAAGMALIDPAAALRAGLRAGRALYPRGSDPHPDVGGHEVLAEVVAEALAATPR